MSKSLFLSLSMLAVAPALAESAAPPPPPPPPPPVATEAPAPAAEKLRPTITVTSVKPTLSARNVFVIRGQLSGGVRSGWKKDVTYKIVETTPGSGTVEVTLDVWASDAETTRIAEPFEAKADIAELKGPQYSGKPGRFDVIVRDAAGNELARTVYEVKPAAKS